MVSNICVFLVIVSIIATPILLLVSLIKDTKEASEKNPFVCTFLILYDFCMFFYWCTLDDA